MKAHKDIQDDWKNNAKGAVSSEKNTVKPDGRPGKIDIHVEVDNNHTAVIEIKESDWDALSPQALKRNVNKIIQQIWSYVETELTRGYDVTPAVIFTNQPASKRRLDLIEAQFGAWGIAVSWEDESIAERKSRRQMK